MRETSQPHLAAQAVGPRMTPRTTRSRSAHDAAITHASGRRLRLRLLSFALRASASAFSRSVRFLPGSAFLGLLRAARGTQARGIEETRHPVGRLGADRQPVLRPLGIERHPVGRALWQVSGSTHPIFSMKRPSRGDWHRPPRCDNRAASWRRRGPSRIFRVIYYAPSSRFAIISS